MWGSLVAGILARHLARQTAAIALVAFAITLFILNFRRSGERAGRLAERLETMEKTNDAQRRMLEAAARRPRSRDDPAERLRDVSF